jgi:3-oxoadipate enol-lactonase
MPLVRADDGVRINYDLFGNPAGEPLLLIQGLGADSRGWIRQRRAFGSRFRCIAPDNRGVGGSDKPDGPYDLEVMARDAITVLEHAGYESAHVMGASMGGVLAQILGVRHRDRVRSLVLACTACRHLPWRRELLEEWAEVASTKGMRSLVDTAGEWLIGPRSRVRFWPVVGMLGPLAIGVPASAFVAQIEAILSLDDALRFELAEVTAPTLLLVGGQDVLTPLADSEEIQAFVPDAELAVIRGAAHGFNFENASSFNRVALEFLDRVVAERTDRTADSA